LMRESSHRLFSKSQRNVGDSRRLCSSKDEWKRSLVLATNFWHPVHQKWLFGGSVVFLLQKVCRSEAVRRAGERAFESSHRVLLL
jgi:hypothetical protein